MKQIASFFNASCIFLLLLCILLLLLPLQTRERTTCAPAQTSISIPLFSFSRQQLDQISFLQEDHSFCLINLGDHFALSGLEELPLRTNPLTELLALLESFPTSSSVVENPPSSQNKIIISSTKGKLELSITKVHDGVLLSDGVRTHLYSENQIEPLLASAEDFIDSTIISVNPSSITLSGNLHAEPLFLSLEETSPIRRSFQNLQASEVIVLVPTAEDFAFFGLDNPFCSTEIFSEGNSYFLHCSKPQSDGTVYLYLEGTPIIYAADLSTLPFLSITKEIVLEKNLFIPNYADTTSLLIESPNSSHYFTKWDGQVLCRGKQIREKEFSKLYQLCTELIPEQAHLLPAENEELLLHLQFAYTNPAKPNDNVSFYSYNETFCSLSINGKKSYLIHRTIVDDILSTTNEIS